MSAVAGMTELLLVGIHVQFQFSRQSVTILQKLRYRATEDTPATSHNCVKHFLVATIHKTSDRQDIILDFKHLKKL